VHFEGIFGLHDCIRSISSDALLSLEHMDLVRYPNYVFSALWRITDMVLGIPSAIGLVALTGD